MSATLTSRFHGSCESEPGTDSVNTSPGEVPPGGFIHSGASTSPSRSVLTGLSRFCAWPVRYTR